MNDIVTTYARDLDSKSGTKNETSIKENKNNSNTTKKKK